MLGKLGLESRRSASPAEDLHLVLRNRSGDPQLLALTPAPGDLTIEPLRAPVQHTHYRTFKRVMKSIPYSYFYDL